MIGNGGFSTIYHALWIDHSQCIDIPVALKLIHGSKNHSEEFIKELKAYCDIGHKNPVFLKCYGISEDTKDYALVMAYARGGCLRENLNLVAQMEWNDKLNLLHSISSDLQIIHSHELIHRDLHSGNILLDDICDAYIADLGLSLLVKENTDEIYGILPYVDPEVLVGKPYTTASDIYSFGIIMWEILYGRPVFDGLKDQSLRPTIIGNVSQHYINLMKGCWEKDSEKRPTAEKICEIFTEWKNNEKILLELSVFKVTFENFKCTYARSKPISKTKAYSQEIYSELLMEASWTPPGSSQINE